MLQINDTPLMLASDRDGRLQKWLETYLPTSDLRVLVNRSPSVTSNRPQTRSGNTPGVGLPLFNYPGSPAPKLNTIYWPTGAARWAFGLFIVDDPGLAAVMDDAGNRNDTVELKIQDETTREIVTLKVNLMRYRPVNIGTSSARASTCCRSSTSDTTGSTRTWARWP